MNHGLLQRTFHYIHKNNNTIFISDTTGKLQHVWGRTPNHLNNFYPITENKIAFTTVNGKIYVWTISTDSTIRLQGVPQNTLLVDIFQTSNNLLVSISNRGDVAWWQNDDGTSKTKKQLPLRRLKLTTSNVRIDKVFAMGPGFIVAWKGVEWEFRLYDSSFHECARFVQNFFDDDYNLLMWIYGLDSTHVLIRFDTRMLIWNVESNKMNQIDCHYLKHDKTNIFGISDDGNICQFTWSPFQQESVWKVNVDELSIVKSDRFCVEIRCNGSFIVHDYLNKRQQVGPQKLPRMKWFKILNQTQLFSSDWANNTNYYWPDVIDLSRYFTFQVNHDGWDGRYRIFFVELKESETKLTQLTCDFLALWIPVVDLQKIVALYI